MYWSTQYCYTFTNKNCHVRSIRDPNDSSNEAFHICCENVFQYGPTRVLKAWWRWWQLWSGWQAWEGVWPGNRYRVGRGFKTFFQLSHRKLRKILCIEVKFPWIHLRIRVRRPLRSMTSPFTSFAINYNSYDHGTQRRRLLFMVYSRIKWAKAL